MLEEPVPPRVILEKAKPACFEVTFNPVVPLEDAVKAANVSELIAVLNPFLITVLSVVEDE